MRSDLQNAFSKPPKGTRVVKFEGAKEAFCAGQDLSEFDENRNLIKESEFENGKLRTIKEYKIEKRMRNNIFIQ